MNPTLRIRALLLSLVLLILILTSCIVIYFRYSYTSESYTAFIYQDGTLLQTIDLSTVTEEYTFYVIASDGGKNQISVQRDGISVQYANCPDKVCVKQGIIRNSLLPITCLPHGLVIELKPNHSTFDTVTY